MFMADVEVIMAYMGVMVAYVEGSGHGIGEREWSWQLWECSWHIWEWWWRVCKGVVMA
jgi:hypothetical protein